jgi:hypothetical protein
VPLPFGMGGYDCRVCYHPSAQGEGPAFLLKMAGALGVRGRIPSEIGLWHDMVIFSDLAEFVSKGRGVQPLGGRSALGATLHVLPPFLRLGSGQLVTTRASLYGCTRLRPS